ncbi:MAG: GDP-mannose 4,6-dehydratase, partial [Actinobacteria bacterium]|nr:GDP-mannose 4,6-dehydratase [Actinomycetota bacterium]
MVKKYSEYNIINLDKLTYAGNLENLKSIEDKPNYKFIKGDIADTRIVGEIFSNGKIDAVVNFAAESHVDRSIDYPGVFIQTDVYGTFVLLEAVKNHK